VFPFYDSWMPAVVLYVATTLIVFALWNRFVQPIPRAGAFVLLLLPTLFTGRALFTGRVYDASDFGYMARMAGVRRRSPHPRV